MKIQGNVFVVTGAGNGMGREVTLQLLGKGARVAGVDLSADGLAETARLAGTASDNLSTHSLSVTDRAAVEALPDAVIAATWDSVLLRDARGVLRNVRMSEPTSHTAADYKDDPCLSRPLEKLPPVS